MTDKLLVTFELPRAIAYALAMSKGWEPILEDTEAELVGDTYPEYANPVTVEQFIAAIGPDFISEFVLAGGRARVISDFASTFDKVEHQVKSGTFDALILAGDVAQIRELVKSSLG